METVKKRRKKTERGAKAVEPGKMVLTNCTDSPRGITLSKGVVILQPREMRVVRDDERDEVRAMFASRTFQRFVDNGIFRLSGMHDDEESVAVKTPEPPAALAREVVVEELREPVGTETGSRAGKLAVVEYQQGGPLAEDG